MANGPTIIFNDASEPMYASGSGGDHILVIGDSGQTKNTSTIYAFGTYDTAKDPTNGIGPEGDDNPLLACIKGIFAEGQQTQASQTLGIEKVYAINVGDNPQAADYAAAIISGNILTDAKLEAYPNLSDISILNSIKTNLASLESQGLFRTAYGTVADNVLADMETMTDNTQTSYIQSDRVYIHTDPTKVGPFVSKVACTPYWQDPAYGPYRSLSASDLLQRAQPDIDALAGDGLIADWISLQDDTLLEPYMAVSTAYRLVDGERPASSLLHARRNADYQFSQVVSLIKLYLKQNNTQLARTLAETAASTYLDTQVSAGYIEDYTLAIALDPSNAFGYITTCKIRVVGATYSMTFNALVEAPTGNINTSISTGVSS